MKKVNLYDKKERKTINLQEFNINSSEENLVALPGFFDVHVHGGYGYAVFDENTEKLITFLKSLLSEGVSKILITTLTSSIEKTESYLKWITNFINSKPWEKEHMASIEGIHLEGPFININKKGAQNSKYIIDASINKIRKWQDMCKGKIKLITYAPEKTNISFQEELNKLKIIGSCGHSECDSETLNKFTNHGLSHITHTFNAMPSLHHRKPGIIGEAFLNEKLNCELISDGHHVCEKTMKILLNNVSTKRTQIITDCIFAKGLKDGDYEFEGLRAYKKKDVFRLKESDSLAGSISYFNKNLMKIKNLMKWNWNDIVRISSANQLKEIFNKDVSIDQMICLREDFFIFNNDMSPLFYINKLGVKKICK